MHRVARHVFTILSGLSLLLCVAVCVLWVRSYWVRDTVGFGRSGGNCHVAQSILGRLHVLSSLGGRCSGGLSHSADRLAHDAGWQGGMSSYPLVVEWRLGFVAQTYMRYRMSIDLSGPGFTSRHRLIVVPYWTPATVLAIAPAVWIGRRVRRHRRMKSGRCLVCGYDLRATPERCPECGMSVVNEWIVREV